MSSGECTEETTTETQTRPSDAPLSHNSNKPPAHSFRPSSLPLEKISAEEEVSNDDAIELSDYVRIESDSPSIPSSAEPDHASAPSDNEYDKQAANTEESGVDVDLSAAEEEDSNDDAIELSDYVRIESDPPSPNNNVVDTSAQAAQANSSRLDANSLAEKEDSPKARGVEDDWHLSFFDEDYLRTVWPPTEHQVARQCSFIEKTLGLKAGSTILDAGCGLGHHAIELASRGYLPVGLDSSPVMLSRAMNEARARNLNVNFMFGDMRELSFEGNFDALLCIGTTFGLSHDDDNKRIISLFYQALKPMGVLLLDVINRDYVLQQMPNHCWFQGDGCLCMEEASFDYITSRMNVKRSLMSEDGQQQERKHSVRLYSLHELGQLLHQQGFRVIQISGSEATPGIYLGAHSPRLIILAERRVSASDDDEDLSGIDLSVDELKTKDIILPAD